MHQILRATLNLFPDFGAWKLYTFPPPGSRSVQFFFNISVFLHFFLLVLLPLYIYMRSYSLPAEAVGGSEINQIFWSLFIRHLIVDCMTFIIEYDSDVIHNTSYLHVHWLLTHVRYICRRTSHSLRDMLYSLKRNEEGLSDRNSVCQSHFNSFSQLRHLYETCFGPYAGIELRLIFLLFGEEVILWNIK